MKEIYVQPCDVWEHYKENEQEFINGAIETIAMNPTTGVEVLLEEWNNIMSVIVEIDGDEIYYDFLLPESADKLVQDVYDTYLSDEVVNSLSLLSSDDYEERLDDALTYMLEVFCPDFEDTCDDISACIKDLKEIIGGYLLEVHGLRV